MKRLNESRIPLGVYSNINYISAIHLQVYCFNTIFRLFTSFQTYTDVTRKIFDLSKNLTPLKSFLYIL